MVTGMAMGIGAAIAELFTEEGASVYGIDVNEKVGAATAEQIKNHGGCCLFHHADVSQEKQVVAAVERGLKEFGEINALVNVVGIAHEAPLDRMELADWERMIRVNLTSMFLTSKYVLPSMLVKGKGSIVHMSSVQALLGFPAHPHYASSKGAIISLTRQMAVEYAARGVRVNCIAPGTVDTPMAKEVLGRAPNGKELLQALERMHPMHRIGQAREIGYGALFLVSDESSFVTGHCLVMDGGLSIGSHA